MIGECDAHLECQVIDAKRASKYNIFIFKVVEVWIAPLRKRPLIMYHSGNGFFTIDGAAIKISSKKIVFAHS